MRSRFRRALLLMMFTGMLAACTIPSPPVTKPNCLGEATRLTKECQGGAGTTAGEPTTEASTPLPTDVPPPTPIPPTPTPVAVDPTGDLQVFFEKVRTQGIGEDIFRMRGINPNVEAPPEVTHPRDYSWEAKF